MVKLERFYIFYYKICFDGAEYTSEFSTRV